MAGVKPSISRGTAPGSPPCSTSARARSSQLVARAQSTTVDTATVKKELRECIMDSTWDSQAKGRIAELQVSLESEGEDIDFERLQGLWRLLYSTALDVAPLMADMRREGRFSLPFQPKVSNVYQRFTSPEEGVVQNIIQLGDGLLFERKKGATFIVNASYKQTLPRTLELTFEEARVCGLQPASLLEALIAPAFLPRTRLQHQLLLAINEFKVSVPLPTRSRLARGDSSAAGKYMLSYCDDDMLVGRALSGGVFIFERECTDLFE